MSEKIFFEKAEDNLTVLCDKHCLDRQGPTEKCVVCQLAACQAALVVAREMARTGYHSPGCPLTADDAPCCQFGSAKARFTEATKGIE